MARYALREKRDFAKIFSVRCVSNASLHLPNPDSVKAAIRLYNMDYDNLLSSLPYLEQVKSNKTHKTSLERDLELFRKFKKMKEAERESSEKPNTETAK